jgi:hypothetical protein
VLLSYLSRRSKLVIEWVSIISDERLVEARILHVLLSRIDLLLASFNVSKALELYQLVCG